MGKATLARQKAIGTIGGGRVASLEQAGLVVLYADDYDKLRADLAELRRANALLRDIAADSAQVSVVAAQVIKELC